MTSYSVSIDFSDRRKDSLEAEFFISANSGSLTLDTTLVTELAVGTADDQIANTALYSSVGIIAAGTVSGTASFDITSIVTASRDGLYLNCLFYDSFGAKIKFSGSNGIVAR